MKKVMIIVVAILVGTMVLNNEKNVIIPKEAIRFRVIANSNSEENEKNKIIVRDEIQTQMITDLNNSNNIEEARTILNNKVSSYENLVSTTLKNNEIDETYKVNYGMNYFPEKNYKGVTYEEGYYESLVVTLGDGLGDNWWCVLFPPLCLLEAEETEETTEVEYKFFIQELIDKYLK